MGINVDATIGREAWVGKELEITPSSDTLMSYPLTEVQLSTKSTDLIQKEAE